MDEFEFSRRRVLAGLGGVGAGALTLGTEPAAASQPTTYNVGTESPAAERAARTAADTVVRVLDWEDGTKTITARFSAEAVANLERRPDVRYTEEDGTMHAIGQTTPWGVERVDADVVHVDGETGGDDGGDGGDGSDDPSGGDIAIIDTGIDSDHPDLKPNLGDGYAVVSARGPYAEAWDDDNGHGTHCAGIADAADNSEGVVGVSTAATLHAVKVLDKGGSGSFSDIAAGIQWVANQGYDVGSLSLGASSGSRTVKDACGYADRNGVLLVGAAGNSGPCTDCVGYPAAYPEVVAVSATDSDDSLAGYSSTGPEVELAAPGTGVYSTYAGGGYETLSGTSMACPHVSGAAAQLMDNGYANAEETTVDENEAYPTNPGGARGQLQDSAESLENLSSDQQGEGLLDVEAALGLGGLSVDSLSVTEVETSNSDAEFDVSWSVSDPEGELSSLELVLYQVDNEGNRTAEESKTPSVSGDSASGTTRLVAEGDEGSGNSYEVTLTVTDSDGTPTSTTATATESETSPAPTVDSLTLSENNQGGSPHADFDVEWTVSDAQGNLDTLDLTLTDLDDGETEDVITVDVSGDKATGTTGLSAKKEENSENTYEVEAIVTDSVGNTGSGTATEVEDGS